MILIKANTNNRVIYSTEEVKLFSKVQVAYKIYIKKPSHRENFKISSFHKSYFLTII